MNNGVCFRASKIFGDLRREEGEAASDRLSLLSTLQIFASELLSIVKLFYS
jgi:hypothetical protein